MENLSHHQRKTPNTISCQLSVHRTNTHKHFLIQELLFFFFFYFYHTLPRLVLLSTFTLWNFLCSPLGRKTHREIWNGEHEAGRQVGFGNGVLEFPHIGYTGLVQRDRNQPQVCHDSFPALHLHIAPQQQQANSC